MVEKPPPLPRLGGSPAIPTFPLLPALRRRQETCLEEHDAYAAIAGDGMDHGGLTIIDSHGHRWVIDGNRVWCSIHRIRFRRRS
jgi:hypothetical protein